MDGGDAGVAATNAGRLFLWSNRSWKEGALRLLQPIKGGSSYRESAWKEIAGLQRAALTLGTAIDIVIPVMEEMGCEGGWWGEAHEWSGTRYTQSFIGSPTDDPLL